MIIQEQLNPEPYEKLAHIFNLKPWQSGIVSEILNWNKIIQTYKVKMDRPYIRHVNMGRHAGHSYLAHCLASTSFPLKTKAYVSSLMYTMISTRVQRSVDVLHDTAFPGYHGDTVDLIVFDMANLPISRYATSIETLIKSIPTPTAILLLQPKIDIF